MTSPFSAPVVVRPEAVAAWAADLAGLAAALDADAVGCRAAGAPLAESLPGEEGWTAASVAVGWGTLLAVAAERTGALARTLEAVAESYRAAEALRADRIPAALADRMPGDR